MVVRITSPPALLKSAGTAPLGAVGRASWGALAGRDGFRSPGATQTL